MAVTREQALREAGTNAKEYGNADCACPFCVNTRNRAVQANTNSQQNKNPYQINLAVNAQTASDPQHIPSDAKERKGIPLATGVVDYFPDALVAVARLSQIGNDQHNPGQPLHWAREKSTDHSDTLIRHFVDRGTLDTDGVRHSAKVAWRALAILQLEIEKARDADLAGPMGKSVETVSVKQWPSAAGWFRSYRSTMPAWVRPDDEIEFRDTQRPGDVRTRLLAKQLQWDGGDFVEYRVVPR